MATQCKTRLGCGLVLWVALSSWSQSLALAQSGAPAAHPTVYQTWRTFTTRDGLPHDSVRAICVSKDKVWVGTDDGLALYEDGGWRSWTKRDGLPCSAISAMDVDSRNGDVWLGTWGGGLIRFTGGRFDQFTQFNSGLSGDLVFAVIIEGDRVWAATNGGVSAFDSIRDAWELHLERRADAPERAIISLNLDRARADLYATAWCGQVYRLDRQRREWRPVVGPHQRELTGDVGQGSGLPGPTLAAVLTDQTLWWVTRTDLFRRDSEGGWAAWDLTGHVGPSNFVYCLTGRNNGEAWLGTDQGLRVLADHEGGTWVTYHCDDGSLEGLATISRNGRIIETRSLDSMIPTARVRCIAFQNDNVWLGTSVGLARGSGRSRSSGLRTITIGQTAPGDDGRESQEDAASVSGPPTLDPNSPTGVEVAVFGPITQTITLPGAAPDRQKLSTGPDTLAVQLAIEWANSLGGYRGKVPFGLKIGTHGYPRYGWGMPEYDLALLASSRSVVGILASLGPDTRTATAVVFRTEVPVINAADSPATIDEQINPWIFRCPGDDPRQHQRLVDYVVEQMGCTRLGLIRTPGVVARRHLDLWGRYAREGRERSRGFVAEVAYDPNAGGLDEALGTLAGSGVEAVFTWCDAAVSARILQRMRNFGMSQLFVGSDRIVSDEFVVLAGPNPGLAVAPYPCPHRKDRKALDRFVERYTEQNSPIGLQRPPTLDAYLTYHATSHLLHAINVAGLDREAIRRALVKMGDTRLATLNKGHWKPVVLPPK